MRVELFPLSESVATAVFAVILFLNYHFPWSGPSNQQHSILSSYYVPGKRLSYSHLCFSLFKSSQQFHKLGTIILHILQVRVKTHCWDLNSGLADFQSLKT